MGYVPTKVETIMEMTQKFMFIGKYHTIKSIKNKIKRQAKYYTNTNIINRCLAYLLIY